MRLLAAAAVTLVLAANARAQGVEDSIDGNPIPDLFAALMGVTLSDELSGSQLVIDNGGPGADDTELSTLKVPWSADYAVGDAPGTLHVAAVAGYLSARDRLRGDTPSGLATVTEDWTVVGASFGLGWTLPVWREWYVRPLAQVGLAYLDNSARYNEAGRIEIEPVIDGIFVNWDAWAATGTVGIGFGHDRDPERLAAGLHARWVLSTTDVVDASSEVWEGSDTSRLAAVRGELGGPSPWSVHGEPLAWDVFGSYLHLGDIEDDVGIFEDLFELGAGTSVRLSPSLPPVRLGASVITGPEVRGWSLGLSLGG